MTNIDNYSFSLHDALPIFSLVQIENQTIQSVTNTDKEDVRVIIRPENINVITKDSIEYDNYFEGEIQFSTYLGSTVRYDIKVGEYTIVQTRRMNQGRVYWKAGHQ